MKEREAAFLVGSLPIAALFWWIARLMVRVAEDAVVRARANGWLVAFQRMSLGEVWWQAPFSERDSRGLVRQASYFRWFLFLFYAILLFLTVLGVAPNR